MSGSNCYFLSCTQISQEADKVVWYPHLLKKFPQFVVIHSVKSFGIVNKAEVSVFSWNSFAFFMIQWLLAIWSLVLLPFPNTAWTYGSSQFIYCWSLTWRTKHYFVNMWDECNSVVDGTLFGIAFLWEWNENWTFQTCSHCWVLQICWHIDCTTLTVSSFRIWNSSTGIPSPPLALFVVMLPKAHLTLYSRMPDSRWVITPLWLSGSEDLFCIVLCILATFS